MRYKWAANVAMLNINAPIYYLVFNEQDESGYAKRIYFFLWNYSTLYVDSATISGEINSQDVARK